MGHSLTQSNASHRSDTLNKFKERACYATYGYVKIFLHLLVTSMAHPVCKNNYNLKYKHSNLFVLLQIIFGILHT